MGRGNRLRERAGAPLMENVGAISKTRMPQRHDVAPAAAAVP